MRSIFYVFALLSAFGSAWTPDFAIASETRAIAAQNFRLFNRGIHSARRLTHPVSKEIFFDVRFKKKTPGNDYPGVEFRFRDLPQNWKNYQYLSFKIANPDPEGVALCVGINQDAAGSKAGEFSAGCGFVVPNKEAVFLVPLTQPDVMNLEGYFGTRLLPRMWKNSLSRESVRSVQILLDKPERARRLNFSDFTLISSYSFSKVVDRFGQNTFFDWPAKVQDLDQMRQARLAEERDWKPWPESFSLYGGMKNGPKLKAAGHFRVEKNDGRWWLVDPEGYLFFSIGMNSVGGSHHTLYQSREKLFTEIPEPAVSVSNGKKVLNFYRSNLTRLGEADAVRRYHRAESRLRSWGFNTLGAWREEGVEFRKPFPYTEIIHLFGSFKDSKVHVPVFKAGEIYFPDFYSGGFDFFARQFIREIADSGANQDPWFLGIFIDNEIHWTGDLPYEDFAVSKTILSLPAAFDAKKKAVSWLKNKYRDVSSLNEAWGARYEIARIDELEGIEMKMPEAINAAVREDLEQIYLLFVEKYFKVVRDAAKTYLPDKLYLGCRFEKKWTPREVARIAAPYLDVMSFNRYDPALDPEDWQWAAEADKPFMITEFHFGSLDRGAPQGGLRVVGDQTERGEAYRRFAESAARIPQCVGFHWFKYLDQPVTGRSLDGENYNCGFVAVTDIAYPELTEKAGQWNRTIYENLKA